MADDPRPLVVTTLEDSVNDWPRHFKDLVDGKDIQRWQKDAVERYAPALFGQDKGGITLGGVLAPGERVVGSWPCFIDDDPLNIPASEGAKVKPHGKWQMGFMVLTDRNIALSHETKRALCMRFAWPREQIREVNLLRFAFSLLSMTSSGNGYEVLLGSGADAERILFRVAVEVRDLNLPELLKGSN